MTRTTYFFYFIFVNIFFFSTPAASGQNFDETWIEFLDNNKISNMSRLRRPDKRYEEEDYAKYLLMSTNNCFCQSQVEKSESLITEIKEMDEEVHEAIPGYVQKLKDLDKRIVAYHKIDKIWNRFLKTKEVTVEELEEVIPPSTICEKHTLVKYSYMTAHSQLCDGEYEQAEKTFESRTIKIAEKTTLKVKDVKGLKPEVAKMKSLFRNMDKLDDAWETYIETGESPGFDIDMPVFACFPIPKMKEYILKGAADVCDTGGEMLDKFKDLQTKSGVMPYRELAKKARELEESVEENESGIAALNKAWKAFIPDNKVKHVGKYGYDFCDRKPLIRAYIMDGFTFACELAEESLEKIDSIQRARPIKLDKTTMAKIEQLEGLREEYDENGANIEEIWKKFVSQGDTLYEDYFSTNLYCDHIQEVKDWTMRGLTASCDDAYLYLEKIENFNNTFEFKLYEGLECRVQNLRFKVWNCRYQSLQEIARLESEADTYGGRLEELMEEYKMPDRPETCTVER